MITVRMNSDYHHGNNLALFDWQRSYQEIKDEKKRKDLEEKPSRKAKKARGYFIRR